MGNFIFGAISTLVSMSILYTAYRLLITLPVQKEMEDERLKAEAEDYKQLYNTDNERNFKL